MIDLTLDSDSESDRDDETDAEDQDYTDRRGLNTPR